jgi:RNA polymerase sigma-70 factor (ECF subfamily)
MLPWSLSTDRLSTDAAADGPDPMIASAASALPDRLADHDSFGDSLDRALRTLPLRQRQVFLLRAWEGMDVADTAQALRISGGSVKTHYFRALAALRAALEPYDE